VRELNIKIYLNSSPNDWSLEINGRLYRHIQTEVLEELVTVAVIETESSCLHEEVIN
jgi:hypothetical protein